MTTERFKDFGSRVSEGLQNMQERCGERAKEWTKATDDYVHDNPWQTVAWVAMGACIVGFLIAGMLRRE